MRSLKGERILLTGANGFLGRHVRRRLELFGANVYGPPRGEMDLLLGDLELEGHYDLIIHAAAFCGGIGLNATHPAEMFTANLRMGQAVIEHCRVYGSRLILLGSVCSYPKHCPTPFKESDLWNGYPEETNAAYGIAKRTIFEMASAYHRQYGMRVACLLPANLFGPGDHFEPERSHVIPAIIRKMLEAKETGAESVTLWGTGTPTREFLYVEDAAEAIVRAAERIETPEPINVGTQIEVSIRHIAELIREVVFGHNEQSLLPRIEWDHSRPDGQPRRRLDCTRVRELLDWGATVALRDGIERTVAWYLANREQPAHA